MNRERQRKSSMRSWRPGKLAKHSGALLIWMLLRAAAQAITVILLARQLGADRYGQVVAAIAIASFLTPFAGLGLSNMVLRNAARDPEHEAAYFAIAWKWWARTLLPCAITAVAVALMLLPAGLPVVVICAAITVEIAVLSLTELVARHRQAQQKIHAYGAINAGLPLFRLLVFVMLFLLTNDATAKTVLWIYAGSGLLYALWLLCIAPYDAEAAKMPMPEPMTLHNGLPFSMAAMAMRLQSEFNKPILAHTGYDLAGSYNVAQRVTDIASLPLLAMQEALWPRLYAHSDPMRQLRSTGLTLLILAVILGCGLWLTAPLLALVLGSGYDTAIVVLRLLAWLPALQLLRSLLNFHTIHHGRMPLIGWASALGAVVSIFGVLALVPKLGISGAVMTSYTAEILMIAYLLLATWRLFIKERSKVGHADT